MADIRDFLQEEYTIDTPENVTFGYDVAGIGNRFIGALLDSVLLVIALVLLNAAVFVALGVMGEFEDAMLLSGDADIKWATGLLLAFYALINFTLIWGYYILFELSWNGQTPGKRVANTRVLRMDGSPAGFSEVAIRNIVRVIDFLPFAYGVGLIVMLFNRKARRLGDYAAGTMVVKDRSEIRLDGLLEANIHGGAVDALPADDTTVRAVQGYAGIGRLSVSDYELVAGVLVRDEEGGVEEELLQRVCTAIAQKLDVPPPARDREASRQFLTVVAQAYHGSER